MPIRETERTERTMSFTRTYGKELSHKSKDLYPGGNVSVRRLYHTVRLRNWRLLDILLHRMCVYFYDEVPLISSV